MTTTDRRLTSRPWRALRLSVLDRDGWVCQVRGPRCTTVATTVDHVVARADGGDFWDPSNLRAACVVCNGGRSAERTNDLRVSRYRLGVAAYETRM